MKPIRPVFPIGIEKETKEGEGRVILIPDHVEALVNDFSKIEKKDVVCLVETGAGVKSGYPDSDYKKAGAIIVPSAAELYRLSSVIVKVKEPSRKEMLMVQEYQRIVAFFHIPPLREYIMPKVSEKTLILYAMERFWDEDGRDPLAAMSTIAGERAVDYARASCGVQGIGDRVVMIIGSNGVVGSAAKSKLLAEGVRWLICVDRRINGGKRWIHDNTEIIEDSELREEYLKSANIVILGARVVNTPAPKIITEKEFRLLPTFATIVDVAIDEGGNCVYSKPTPPSEAPYVVDGRKIYAIPNLPGTVPERSSPLISAAMLPYIKKLVHHLVEGTPLDKCLVNSVITKDSKI